jgi:hypothetical protein
MSSPHTSPHTSPQTSPQTNPATNNSATTTSSAEFDSNIVNVTLEQTIDISGAQINTVQGTTVSGIQITNTTFDTLEHPENDAVDIDQDLKEAVRTYYDDISGANTEKAIILNEIKGYAAQIQCEKFQGKGTIEDYNELFVAASKIAHETKQMQLNVDVGGFNEFAQAADDLSTLFDSFILRLQSISIVDDLNFLKSIRTALAKIAHLADTFGKFKQTIMATAKIDLPKSAHETRLVVEDVMSEVNCAMNYINHYINPETPAPANADLSAVEKNIIRQAVATIDNWSILCQQDVSIAMSDSPDINYIKTANAALSTKAGILRNNVASLRAKLSVYSTL